VSFAAQFCFEVEGVRAVEVDVVVLRRCQVRCVFVGDGVAVGTEGIERIAEVGGGPQDRSVGAESQAEGLIDLVIEVPAPDVALVGEEQVAAQGVQALALVQLSTDSASEFFVGDVAAQVDGAHEPSVFLERSGE